MSPFQPTRLSSLSRSSLQTCRITPISLTSTTTTSNTHSPIPITSTNITQCRHAATTRRTTKALRVAPSATAAPGSKYLLQRPSSKTQTSTTQTPATATIVFNPPPSAPTPYITPPLFLPPSDPRKTLLAQSHLFANPYATGSRALPPPVRSKPAPERKQYHLSEADIAEIRALRASDPWEWTVPKLAERFGCSRIFIGIAAPASKERREWGLALHQRFRDRWGGKRREAREERGKRRRLWERDL